MIYQILEEVNLMIYQILEKVNLTIYIRYSRKLTLRYISDTRGSEPYDIYVCLFALRPKSPAMVIAGRSVHLTTLFPGQA